jgi:hypothetical protein
MTYNPNQPRVPKGSGDASGEWAKVGDRVERKLPGTYPADVRFGRVVEVTRSEDNKGVLRDAVRVVIDKDARGVKNPFTGKVEKPKGTVYLRTEVKIVGPKI